MPRIKSKRKYPEFTLELGLRYVVPRLARQQPELTKERITSWLTDSGLDRSPELESLVEGCVQGDPIAYVLLADYCLERGYIDKAQAALNSLATGLRYLLQQEADWRAYATYRQQAKRPIPDGLSCETTGQNDLVTDWLSNR